MKSRPCLTGLILLLAWFSPATTLADQKPAKGRFLVATDVVQGEIFGETVILLIHYDETGAMGLVVNRPTDLTPAELVDEDSAFAAHQGELYWGGPVQMGSLRALMLTDSPPVGAETVLSTVHQVPADEKLFEEAGDASRLRFYIGYSGWGPGQLDREMAQGSWHIVPATEERIFAEYPRALWEQLRPARDYRAGNDSVRASQQDLAPHSGR